ncbi:MAG: hypothetical protein K2L67_03530 [Clostridia bacterium]|nr:hypothetical protein [Clostridia bacterium]
MHIAGKNHAFCPLLGGSNEKAAASVTANANYAFAHLRLAKQRVTAVLRNQGFVPICAYLRLGEVRIARERSDALRTLL